MKNNNFKKTGLVALALAAGSAGVANAQNARIYLNGQPFQTESPAMTMNGRLVVPMRDIFEGLGATVQYNPLTKGIFAQRGDTNVTMALGSRNAAVNALNVTLDAPATSYNGRTYVPLRFVAEALGAQVGYDPGTRVATINSSLVAANPGNGGSTGGSQVGGIRQISVPANAVIKVTLDDSLSSKTAAIGQTFTSTVVSQQLGDSEFPAGTKIRGQVTAVTPRQGQAPGQLGVRFIQAILPDGTTVPLNGTLIQLDAKNTTTENGRIVATGQGKKNNSTAVIGIGAGAGYVLGKLLDKNELVTALLGAGAGFLFDKSQNKAVPNDVNLAAGQQLGIRVLNPVTYSDTTGYASDRANFLKL